MNGSRDSVRGRTLGPRWVSERCMTVVRLPLRLGLLSLSIYIYQPGVEDVEVRRCRWSRLLYRQ
eukprot:7376261-Prymnesium_polylepis.1